MNGRGVGHTTDSSDSRALADAARESALRMVAASGASHIGSSLSVMDILAVIYSIANITPRNASETDRDIVILSKGHASAAMYAILAHKGFFPISQLIDFCADGSPLSGHVTSGTVPGIEFSTGSLGHGIGFGLGIAISALRDGNSRHVFAVASDGECDEGSTWEAALIAAHHGVGNLTVIVDRNGLQSFGSTEETLGLEPLDAKWKSFGWQVLEADGHDHDHLMETFARAKRDERPSVILAKTVKGHGVSFMENRVEWHYKSPSAGELEAALQELAQRNA